MPSLWLLPVAYLQALWKCPEVRAEPDLGAALLRAELDWTPSLSCPLDEQVARCRFADEWAAARSAWLPEDDWWNGTTERRGREETRCRPAATADCQTRSTSRPEAERHQVRRSRSTSSGDCTGRHCPEKRCTSTSGCPHHTTGSDGRLSPRRAPEGQECAAPGIREHSERDHELQDSCGKAQVAQSRVRTGSPSQSCCRGHQHCPALRSPSCNWLGSAGATSEHANSDAAAVRDHACPASTSDADADAADPRAPPCRPPTDWNAWHARYADGQYRRCTTSTRCATCWWPDAGRSRCRGSCCHSRGTSCASSTSSEELSRVRDEQRHSCSLEDTPLQPHRRRPRLHRNRACSEDREASRRRRRSFGTCWRLLQWWRWWCHCSSFSQCSGTGRHEMSALRGADYNGHERIPILLDVLVPEVIQSSQMSDSQPQDDVHGYIIPRTTPRAASTSAFPNRSKWNGPPLQTGEGTPWSCFTQQAMLGCSVQLLAEPRPCFKGPMRLLTDPGAMFDLRPATIEALASTPAAAATPMFHSAKPSELHVYADGSASREDHSNGVGWAFVACCRYGNLQDCEAHDHHGFMGYLAGHCRDYEHAFEAEVLASIYALVWVRHMIWADLIGPDCKVVLHISNLATLNIVNTVSDKPEHDVLPAVAAFLRRMVKLNICAKHVEGHSNVGWNELADRAAKHARLHPGAFPANDRHTRHLLSMEVQELRSLHLGEEDTTGVYPQLIDGDNWIPGPRHGWEPAAFGERLNRCDVRAVPPHELPNLPFRLASANVKSISDSATYHVGLNVCSRSYAIQKMFREDNILIAGIQEARTRSGQRRNMLYNIIASGRCEGPPPNFGCEIWVASEVTCGGEDYQIQLSNICTLLSEPRLLMITVTSKAMTIDVVTCHAPLPGSPQMESFWVDVSRRVHGLRRSGIPLVLLGDFNHAPACFPDVVGNLACAADDLRETHPCVRSLVHLGLFLPHTYADCTGRNFLEPTCLVNNGRSVIDYIGLPVEWRSQQVHADVRSDLDISFGDIDHLVVTCDVTLPRRGEAFIRNRRAPGYDVTKAAAPESRPAVERIWRTAPQVHWEVDISTHVELINEHVRAGLRREFPMRRGRRAPDWMATGTLDCIRRKAAVFSQIVTLRRQGVTTGDTIAQLREQHRLLARDVRKHTRKDKKAHLDFIAADVNKAFDDCDARRAYKRMRTLLPYKGNKNPIVRDKQGKVAREPASADKVWHQHWTTLLDGQDDTFEGLLRENRSVDTDDAYFLERHDLLPALPTVDNIAYIIAKTGRGKASGLDAISADIHRQCPVAAAHALLPIYHKMITWQQHPLQWSGDLHIAIPKANGQARGIALVDNAAKFIHKYARPALVSSLQNIAGDMTFGGIPARGADMAAHGRTLAVRLAKDKGLCCACLFIDVFAAFDNVRHEQVFDFARQQKDPRYNVVMSAYQTPWTITPRGDNPIRRGKGTQQGDPLSDVVFLLAFIPLLNHMRELHEADGLDLALFPGSILKNQHEGDNHPMHMFDLSYMDDAFFTITAKNPQTLLERLSKVCSSIHREMKKAGFSLNFSRGKTEACIFLQGAGSRHPSLRTIREDGLALDDGQILRCVETYKHMGLIHSHKAEEARMIADAANKLQESQHTFSSLFRSSLNLKHKKKAANICLARALYGAHIWVGIQSPQMTKLRTRFHRLLRAATGLKQNPHTENFHTDKEVRDIAGFSSLHAILRFKRLGYLPRLLTGPLTLRALVQNEEKWRNILVDDLEWAHIWHDEFEDFPHPAVETEWWEKMISDSPKAWKNSMHRLQCNLLDGLIPDIQPEQHRLEDGVLLCGQCDRVFTSVQGLNLHCKRAHNRHAPARPYAHGRDCLHCLRVFWEPTALTQPPRPRLEQKTCWIMPWTTHASRLLP
eukprot:TRINITY_DN40704_c0_g1_i2.p1 TRINITY_DN40704_c0_g1~~TRINITY_DN40704_c0_g1_i2.p1  ORF type:complete len:1896 (+),score=139.04 TRINITY_DN40704_c0_g1_i2:341-6028(+)